jgi:hypothetical protein
VVVALVAATLKTVLQVNVPSAQDIRIIGWGVSFDGISGTGVPIIAHLSEHDAAATGGTSLTPDNWGNSIAPASVCIGGAALTMYNAGAEVSPSSTSRTLDQQHVHPQSGYGVYWPGIDHQPKCGNATAARFVKIRCKAAAGVNVLPWILWAEPSI